MLLGVTAVAASGIEQRYDANENGFIERAELADATRDYFKEDISREAMDELMQLYNSGLYGRYDANDDGLIDGDEVIAATLDYFKGGLSKKLLRLYDSRLRQRYDANEDGLIDGDELLAASVELLQRRCLQGRHENAAAPSPPSPASAGQPMPTITPAGIPAYGTTTRTPASTSPTRTTTSFRSGASTTPRSTRP